MCNPVKQNPPENIKFDAIDYGKWSWSRSANFRDGNLKRRICVYNGCCQVPSFLAF